MRSRGNLQIVRHPALIEGLPLVTSKLLKAVCVYVRVSHRLFFSGVGTSLMSFQQQRKGLSSILRGPTHVSRVWAMVAAPLLGTFALAVSNSMESWKAFQPCTPFSHQPSNFEAGSFHVSLRECNPKSCDSRLATVAGQAATTPVALCGKGPKSAASGFPWAIARKVNSRAEVYSL